MSFVVCLCRVAEEVLGLVEEWGSQQDATALSYEITGLSKEWPSLHFHCWMDFAGASIDESWGRSQGEAMRVVIRCCEAEEAARSGEMSFAPHPVCQAGTAAAQGQLVLIPSRGIGGFHR